MAPPSAEDKLARKGSEETLNASKEEAAVKSRIKRYDEYYDYRSHSFKLKTHKPDKKKRSSKDVVIFVRRRIDYKGRHQDTQIDIKSPGLAQVLEKLNPEVESLEQRDPPMADPVLFYHSRFGLRREYETEKAKEKPNNALVNDLMAALQFIEEDHGSNVATMKSLLDREEISWGFLWALFIPNALVYHLHELTQQHQILRFLKARKRWDNRQGVWYWQMICDTIVFDGQKFGYARVDHFRIDEYPGARKVYDLEIYPLEFARNKDSIRETATERGKCYANITESKYFECEGPAMREILNKNLDPQQFTFPAFGRAMIDPNGFRTFEPNATYNYRVYKQLDRELQDEQFSICSPVVMGFSFGAKLWGGLGIDYCHPVEWGHDAYRSLVLEPKKKNLVRSLVTQHTLGVKQYDDVVAGKGKGLIGLLSGRPGCGKTLTAEAISEETERPLYMVSAGELGTQPKDVDERLTLVLELARRWNAILLLDEADVFLHRRSDTDVIRNALVSIFLRQLEYYKGILILTTNRIDTFDPAFESRIHFSLHYPDLDVDSRRQLWQTFFARSTAAGTLKTSITNAQLDELAHHKLNGRQIKNLVSSAQSQALQEQEPLSISHIRTVLEVASDWTAAVEHEVSGAADSAPVHGA